MKNNKKDSKQMLFEMMHKVGGMPLNENYTEEQKDYYRKLVKELTPQERKNFFLDSEYDHSHPNSGNEFHNRAKMYFESLPHNELFDLVSRLDSVSEVLFKMLTEEEKKKIIYNKEVVHPQVIINNLKNVEDVKDYIKYIAHQFPDFYISSNTFRNIPEKHRMLYIYEVMQFSKNKLIDYRDLLRLFFLLEEKNQDTLLRLLDDTKLPYYVAKVKKEQEEDDRIYNLKLKRKKIGIKGLPKVEYGDSGTYAFYDKDTDTYYNNSAQELKNPNDWDKERKDNFFDYGDSGND